MKSVGFKEWAVVCEALGRGEQCILLRKGGIAEGRAGFSFQHEEFFLFPTLFHEQVEKTRSARTEVPARVHGQIELRYLAKIELSAVVTSWETAVALEPFHILRRDVVRERFDYSARSDIHVAFVRVFALTPEWMIEDQPAYGGCRSWLTLPEMPNECVLNPVLSEKEHQQRAEQMRDVIGAGVIAASAPGSTGC